MAILPKKKLADLVIDEIKEMLKRGDIKEGDKLPDQNKFAQQLGVSRMSLREALHTLQLMGVIKQSPRIGTIIISGNPDLWVKNISPPLLSDSKSSTELLEARKLIECGIVKKSVKIISSENILELQNKVTAMEEALNNEKIDEFLSLDLEFHLMIVSISGNRYLIHMFSSLINPLEQFIRECYQVFPDKIHEPLKYHKLIFESLKEQNERKVVHYMKEHIKSIEKMLIKYYSSR